ncbi:AraC-like DNA-binding protein [Sphingomonas zeicaulis]|uniref:helix-turn-helix domain-containing protein n=1 Tax=Sphingomonas zeicaulis TaxID=1632740 RepID=UPI003D24E8C2
MLGPGIRSLCQRLGETADVAFRFALLEQAIVRRLAEAPPPDAAMLHAERRLAHGASVAMLAAELDLSRQHFARRFRETTGLAPAAYAQLCRFERFCAAIAAEPAAPLATLAPAAGYHDQPHLARAVRTFAAMTPGELRQRLLPQGYGVRED